jgi:3-dehydroquinate dehydratase-2
VLDALKMCEGPVVEVHISNIHKRTVEADWRGHSIMSAGVTGVVAGLGVQGYVLALDYIALALAGEA